MGGPNVVVNSSVVDGAEDVVDVSGAIDVATVVVPWGVVLPGSGVFVEGCRVGPIRAGSSQTNDFSLKQSAVNQ